MEAQRPLVVVDTNILMDLWLSRDDAGSSPMLELAEEGGFDLVVAEYALREFQGRALLWLQAERAKLNQQVRAVINPWGRSRILKPATNVLQQGVQLVEQHLAGFQEKIPEVMQRVSRVARVVPHTPELHTRGELRHVSAMPPFRAGSTKGDCYIYEVLLDIARAERGNKRPKFFATRDNDFDHPELQLELEELGFSVRKHLGRLYGELRAIV
jgi:hypothetical protein